MSRPSAAPVPTPKFPKDEAGFFNELRRRVNAYFADNRIDDRDSPRMYLKTLVILSGLVASYVGLVFFASAWWQAVPLAVVFALFMCLVGFSIQHDANHAGYSRRNWVNRLGGATLDMIGASSYVWHWKHGILHHTYANIDGHDSDIDAGMIARLSPHQPRYWFHRWQHIYLWPVYALTSPRWHLWGDFKDVLTGKIGSHPIPRPKGWDLVQFVGGKAFSIAALLVLPMFFHEWWVVVLFYFLVTGVIGVVLTVVFQLAHCVEEAEFPAPVDASLRMEDAWAVHQVETTVDFSRDSKVLTYLLGGLNFQIVHHLFPRICHVHYPALSRIVEATCKEYGVRYQTHDSFAAGVRSHYRWLKRLGQPDAVPAPQPVTA
jgi:linoleoyl-CoA desaturase